MQALIYWFLNPRCRCRWPWTTTTTVLSTSTSPGYVALPRVCRIQLPCSQRVNALSRVPRCRAYEAALYMAAHCSWSLLHKSLRQWFSTGMPWWCVMINAAEDSCGFGSCLRGNTACGVNWPLVVFQRCVSVVFGILLSVKNTPAVDCGGF